MAQLGGKAAFKDKVLKYLFDRYISWRLEALASPEYPVLLEYPIDSRPRYGHGKPPHPALYRIIDRNRSAYKGLLSQFLRFKKDYARIAETQTSDSGSPDPYWFNDWFSGLDAAALYAFLSLKNPCTYFEIGSGNSTKFARRAIRDHGLRTRIISCDPQPRVEIDFLCDEVIRSPVEKMNLGAFDVLEPGDILFVDNSHRVFMNSDVTVVFLDILPRLRKGVMVHFHDIFLPFDYPPEWIKRHYSEQYLLGCYLLAEGEKLDVFLPNALVSSDEELAGILRPLWDAPALEAAYRHTCSHTGGFHGSSFWVQVR